MITAVFFSKNVATILILGARAIPVVYERKGSGLPHGIPQAPGPGLAAAAAGLGRFSPHISYGKLGLSCFPGQAKYLLHGRNHERIHGSSLLVCCIQVQVQADVYGYDND